MNEECNCEPCMPCDVDFKLEFSPAEYAEVKSVRVTAKLPGWSDPFELYGNWRICYFDCGFAELRSSHGILLPEFIGKSWAYLSRASELRIAAQPDMLLEWLEIEHENEATYRFCDIRMGQFYIDILNQTFTTDLHCSITDPHGLMLVASHTPDS